MSPQQIRQARTRLGLSLEGLARALGVAKQTVWHWEQSERSPNHREPPPYLWRAIRDLEREHTGAS